MNVDDLGLPFSSQHFALTCLGIAPIEHEVGRILTYAAKKVAAIEQGPQR